MTEQPGAALPDGADERDAAGSSEHGAARATVGTMFGRDGLYMLASSLQLLSGVLVTPIVTRVLGLHQYGIFAGDLALLYVLYYTANLGLNIGIQRLFSQPDGERRSRNLLATSVVVVAAVIVLVYATGPLWAPRLGFGPFPLSTKLTVVWSGLFALTWIWLAILRCNERLRVFATVCLLQSIVGIGLGAVVAFLGSGLATEVLWCAVVVQAVALLLGMWTIRPHWRGIFDFATTRSTLWFSLPVLPLQLSTFTMSAADRFVILRDLGPAATGRYQVAYTVSAVGVSMLTFLNLAWLLRIFAITDRTTRAEVLAHSRDGLYLLLVPVTLALALGAPVRTPDLGTALVPDREPAAGHRAGRRLHLSGLHRLRALAPAPLGGTLRVVAGRDGHRRAGERRVEPGARPRYRHQRVRAGDPDRLHALLAVGMVAVGRLGIPVAAAADLVVGPRHADGYGDPLLALRPGLGGLGRRPAGRLRRLRAVGAGHLEGSPALSAFPRPRRVARDSHVGPRRLSPCGDRVVPRGWFCPCPRRVPLAHVERTRTREPPGRSVRTGSRSGSAAARSRPTPGCASTGSSRSPTARRRRSACRSRRTARGCLRSRARCPS